MEKTDKELAEELRSKLEEVRVISNRLYDRGYDVNLTVEDFSTKGIIVEKVRLTYRIFTVKVFRMDDI